MAMTHSHAQVLDRHGRVFGVVDAVVHGVPADAWAKESPCPGWSARHVLEHLAWGQQFLAAWAQSRPAPDPAEGWAQDAAPSELPERWDRQRAATRELLTPEALEVTRTTGAFGTLPLGEFAWTFGNDALLHTWDIATTAGLDAGIPEDLAECFLAWCREHEAGLRRPGMFGPAIPVPASAGVVQRWLGFAGRKAG